MSNEEMNKKMEFIVEQQAKFAADIEMMREVQAANEKQMGDLSRAVVTLVALVGELAESQKCTDERINSLADAQARTDESIKLLTEAQARTDARLNILIDVVDRHIAGNGGPHSHT
jgi:peptidoglycan hydrolase CwlO-like protein